MSGPAGPGGRGGRRRGAARPDDRPHGRAAGDRRGQTRSRPEWRRAERPTARRRQADARDRGPSPRSASATGRGTAPPRPRRAGGRQTSRGRRIGEFPWRKVRRRFFVRFAVGVTLVFDPADRRADRPVGQILSRDRPARPGPGILAAGDRRAGLVLAVVGHGPRRAPVRRSVRRPDRGGRQGRGRRLHRPRRRAAPRPARAALAGRGVQLDGRAARDRRAAAANPAGRRQPRAAHAAGGPAAASSRP